MLGYGLHFVSAVDVEYYGLPGLQHLHSDGLHSGYSINFDVPDVTRSLPATSDFDGVMNSSYQNIEENVSEPTVVNTMPWIDPHTYRDPISVLPDGEEDTANPTVVNTMPWIDPHTYRDPISILPDDEEDTVNPTVVNTMPWIDPHTYRDPISILPDGEEDAANPTVVNTMPWIDPRTYSDPVPAPPQDEGENVAMPTSVGGSIFPRVFPEESIEEFNGVVVEYDPEYGLPAENDPSVNNDEASSGIMADLGSHNFVLSNLTGDQIDPGNGAVPIKSSSDGFTICDFPAENIEFDGMNCMDLQLQPELDVADQIEQLGDAGIQNWPMDFVPDDSMNGMSAIDTTISLADGDPTDVTIWNVVDFNSASDGDFA